MNKKIINILFLISSIGLAIAALIFIFVSIFTKSLYKQTFE